MFQFEQCIGVGVWNFVLGKRMGLIGIELNGTWGLCFKHVVSMWQMWSHLLKIVGRFTW